MNDVSRSNEFEAVLESAARLQQLVPDAVRVGGSAAALHAQHRETERFVLPSGAALNVPTVDEALRVKAFSEPAPRDARVISQLGRYKKLDPRWADWQEVTSVLGEVATEIATGATDRE